MSCKAFNNCCVGFLGLQDYSNRLIIFTSHYCPKCDPIYSLYRAPPLEVVHYKGYRLPFGTLTLTEPRAVLQL